MCALNLENTQATSKNAQTSSISTQASAPIAQTSLKNAQAMPAKTWHRLHMNDTEIEISPHWEAAYMCAFEGENTTSLDEILGEADAFERAIAKMQEALDAALENEPEDTRAVLVAADQAARENVARAKEISFSEAEDLSVQDTGNQDALDQDAALKSGALENLDICALSEYEQAAIESEVARDILADFETGAGIEVEEYLSRLAGAQEITGTQVSFCAQKNPGEQGNPGTTVFCIKPNQKAEISARITSIDGKANVSAIDIVASKNSEVSLNIHFDSPDGGCGLVGTLLRVCAESGARVHINSTSTLSQDITLIDAQGYVLDKSANLNMAHRVLGGGKTYTALGCDLRGKDAQAQISTRYLGHGNQSRDFNYIVRHRGTNTQSNLEANGVLCDSSQKVLRGTIDLVHGCKGAQGSEREVVLLADKDVENKTIPVILCDEDDVAGNHGATIGHVRAEQLNYLMSRGISKEAAERLFANATLEETVLATHDARVRTSIARLAHELGINCDAFEEDDFLPQGQERGNEPTQENVQTQDHGQAQGQRQAESQKFGTALYGGKADE